MSLSIKGPLTSKPEPPFALAWIVLGKDSTAGFWGVRLGRFEFALSEPSDKTTNLEDHPDCFLWLGEINGSGYGRVWIDDRRVAAHRVIYSITRASISPDRQLDHLCGNRRCCNPNHLKPVTPAEHNARTHPRKTACKHGHDWTVEGSTTLDKDGYRRCRECDRLRSAKRRKRITNASP